MSRKREVHNTREIEKLFDAARAWLDFCGQHRVTITPYLIEAIHKGDLPKEIVAPPRLEKSYIKHKLGGKLDTIPEVPEIDVLGED